MNLPLPTGEVDFVIERSEFTKSGEGTIFKVLNGTKKRCAFTLSEVLIVLAVLGVVAVMTIPDLIQDYREKATVTAVKRIYSVLNQAVDMGVAENGPVETWDWGTKYDGQSAVNVFRENIKPSLKIMKDCGTSTGCWYNGYIKNLQGQNYAHVELFTTLAKAVLSDGTSLSLSTFGGSCNSGYGTTSALQHICGSIYIDTNGRKQPNTMGKDVFLLYVTSQGIIPAGTSNEFAHSLSSYCTISGYEKYNGAGCAAWVIQKENMDYLRKTVSW